MFTKWIFGWRSPYAGSKYHGSPWLLSLLGPLTAKRIEGQPDHILGPLPTKSSILQIDRLENVFTKRKNVLKPKFHNFKKYTFRSWILCFCYLFYFFCVFKGESTEVGYRIPTEWTSGGRGDAKFSFIFKHYFFFFFLFLKKKKTLFFK